MRRVLPLALALLFVASGCAHYSDNHRRGLLAGGGAATFIGAIIAVDGAYCDKNMAGGDCEEGNDSQDLISGSILMAAGIAVFGLAYYFKPVKPAGSTTPM